MRKTKFTESQIMAALKQFESGVTVNDVCRQVGVSSETFYKWKAKTVVSRTPRCPGCASSKKRTSV